MKLSKRANLQVAAGLATVSMASFVACGGGGSSSPAPAPTATAPAISGQPTGQTVVAGANASFTVAATGNGTLSYQWRKNGTAVSGATSATLSLTAVTATNEGAYECVVTNSLGSSTEMAISAGATLSVNTAPAILGQPANQAAPAGAGVTFTVVADGNGTLSYQWQKDGADIAGATSASYSIAAISSGDVASYTCVVTNTLGTTTTTTTTAAATATISLAATPVITAQPVAATLAQGGNASFSVTATGTGTLSYQWFKDGVALGGATSASLDLTGVTLGDAASYSCLITNSLSGASSSISTIPAALAVVGLPAISAQPAGATLVQGTNGSLSLSASANGTLSYQWFKDGAAIAGATAASLNLTGVAAGDAGSYECVVTNTLNGVSTTLTSAAAMIAVNAAAAISAQPVSVTELEAGSTTLTVAAAGSGTVTYQWQKNGVDIAGANGTSLVLANLAAGDAASYACVVTNTLNGTTTTVTSASAVVSVNLNPAITAQPTAQGAAVGQSATFTVAATGAAGATLNYQWRKNGADIGGATDATYQTTNLVVGDDGATYDCLITGTLNGTTTPATTSTSVAVSAAVVPAVTIASSATNFQGGEAAPTLTATVSNLGTLNGVVTYQWKKGNIAILGATASTYTLPGAVTAADAGSYTCMVTNTRNLAVGTATSTGVTLAVLSAPVITTDLPAVNYKNGTVSPTNSFISVSASLPSGGTLSYQWQVSTDGGANYANVVGATSSSYSAPAYPTGTARMYRCSVTNTVTGFTPIAILSSACTVTLYQTAQITTQPVATNVVAGSAAALTVTPTAITLAGTNQAVQWYKGFATNVGVAIPGATSATLNIAAADAADSNYYYAIVTNSLPGATATSTATSAVVRLGVNTAPTITTQPAAAPIATEGSSFTLTTAATGAPNAALTYQWKKGGVAIAGANGASYTLASPAAADAGSYTCDITSSMTGTAAQVATTNASTLVVNQKPTNLTPVQTGNTTTGPVTLTVTPTNPNTGSYLTYQWKRNGASISGAIQAAYTINEITSTSAGNYTCDVNSVFVATATSNASTATAVSPIAAVGVGTGVTTPVVTMGSTYTAGKTGNAISCDSQAGATYEWSVTNGSITAGQGTNAITVTVGANTTLPMTATVVVSNATGGAVGTASAPVVAAVATPKLLAPASVHPGDTWMKAGLDNQVGTFAWGMGGAGLITGGAPIDTLVLPFSANAGALGGDTITLTANVQNGASDAAPTATKTVTVTTGTWLNKDGGAPWVLGAGANMNGSASAVFANGRILMCGGQTLSSYTPATAAIYDPATQRWIRVADMNIGRTGHTATALANGTILVTGGTTFSSVTGTTYLNNGEIYDPVTNTWILLTSTNMGTGRLGHTATLLTAGANVNKVAILGGKFGSSDYATTIAIFQPSGSAGNFPGGTFSTAPVSLGLPRERHTATALNDGRVLIAGGQGITNEAYQQAEILDVTASFTGSWSCTKVGSLTDKQRLGHSATMLADGKVLLVAGSQSANTAELFDPATGTFTATTGTLKGGHLAVNVSGRYQHGATRLADGRVLLTGGQGGTNQGVGQSTEVYDPATGLFTNLTPMNSGRYLHSTVALPNGTVMVMGGSAPNIGTTSSTEIFDPAANAGMGSWSTVGSLNGRSLATATRLQDGRVLVVGGQNGWQGNDTTTTPATSQGIARSTQIYDPATGTWIQGGLLATARYSHSMVQLPNGKVMVSGGTGPQAGLTALKSAEIFDPTTNTWSSTGDMSIARQNHGMIALPDGKVLVMGGVSGGPFVSSSEIWDPATNLWTATGAMSEVKTRIVPILLSNGKVLVAGGNSASSNSPTTAVEVFDPATQSWATLTPLAQARDQHYPFALPNGKFVLLGGRVVNPNFGFTSIAGANGLAGALEIYDTLANGGTGATVPTANAFFKTEGRASIVAAGGNMLSDGRIILAGGTLSSTTGASTSEIYDPATDTLTVGPALTTGHGSGLLSVTLANGDVMLIGGGNTDTLTQIFRP